jgi:ABC-type multidrug transport system ATPase subunit
MSEERELSIITAKVTKRYRRASKDALHEVSMHCEQGIYGLLGPNGAGKTTLMRILATLIAPTAGRATVQGIDVAQNLGQVRSLIGYMPQEYALYPQLTGREFLVYMAGLSNLPEPRKQVDRVLEEVAMTSHARERLKTFSGGMKQRIVIAQALLHNPPVLLVDEPTAGLDPAERVRFRNLLAELALARTVLLSTHIVEDIVASCREVTVLFEGKVIFAGGTHALIASTEGKVWEAQAPAEALNELRAQYTVISSRPASEANQVEVRFLSAGPSAELNATAVAPNMEDAYLWLISARGNHATAA